jgi:hypothetical protein
MLFESKQRTRTAPKKPGEGDFEFYDSRWRGQRVFERVQPLLDPVKLLCLEAGAALT